MPHATLDSTTDVRARAASRSLAIDWMRGFVMLLMTLDHASQFWNAERTAIDSAYLTDPATGAALWTPGATIDAAQFWLRFVTHLCAPTFLFLVGTSLALSASRRAAGWRFDLHLLRRAALIVACEALLSTLAQEGVWILQVLFAIACALLAMIVLRRLPTTLVVALGLAWIAGGEALTTWIYPLPGSGGAATPDLVGLALFVPAYASPVTSLYPALGWVALCALGWGFGHALPALDASALTRRCLLFAGIACTCFVALRAFNGYGNMGLYCVGDGLLPWLQLSKYPLSASFISCQLAIMFALLALFVQRELRLGDRKQSARIRNGPMLVFGQTALFYYMAHFFVLGGMLFAIRDKPQQDGLGAALVAAPVCIALLYPICLLYRRLRSIRAGGPSRRAAPRRDR